MQKIHKVLEKDDAASKEAYIQQQLREMEQTLRQQTSPEKGEKKKVEVHDKPKKHVNTRAITINDRVKSPKKGRMERPKEKV